MNLLGLESIGVGSIESLLVSYCYAEIITLMLNIRIEYLKRGEKMGLSCLIVITNNPHPSKDCISGMKGF